MAMEAYCIRIFSLLLFVVTLPPRFKAQCVDGYLGKTCGMPPRDCSDLLAAGQTTNGVYTVYPKGARMSFPVYCDMVTDGGGWLVFQRRKDGSQDFYMDWVSYEKGFGEPNAEFWLGNYKLYLLTGQRNYEMRIDMEDFDFIKAHAKYSRFSVAGPMDNYRLTVGGFNGTKTPNIGDSFSPIHNNHTFSTKDFGKKVVCATSYKGGWWFNHCHAVHLNGVYLTGEHQSYANGIVWSSWRGNNYSLKFTEMKIRPILRTLGQGTGGQAPGRRPQGLGV